MVKKLVLAVLIGSVLYISSNVKAAVFTNNQVVAANKSWTIHFNDEVAFDNTLESEITVMDSEGKKIDVTISLGSDRKTVTVNPPQALYTEGEHYKLVIGKDVHDVNNNKINNEIEVDFSIENNEENINGNAANGGKAILNNGFIYYSGVNGLYKEKADGTGRVKLLEDAARDINVVGDWIYYLNETSKENETSRIYKVKTDGTEKTEVYSDSYIGNLIVANGWMYYKTQDEDFNYEICKVKTDGTDKQLLTTDEFLKNISISGDYIYYNTGDGIYKLKNDGSDKVKLQNGDTEFMLVHGENIYFETSGEDYSVNDVYKMDLEGNGTRKIFTINSEATELFQAWFFNVDKDFIYYSTIDSNGGSLYRIKTDGTQNTKISDDYCNNINIAGDKLFCDKIKYASGNYDYPAYNMELYSLNKDGSQKQVVDSGIVLDN